MDLIGATGMVSPRGQAWQISIEEESPARICGETRPK